MDIDLVKKARLRLLKMHYEAKVGHLGGNLSALDALVFLHSCVLEKDDVFVLSKGHAAGALYIALWACGKLDEASLAWFHQDGGKIAGHPVGGWHEGIPFSTGSLGHGVGLAAGRAFGKRLNNTPGSVFCMTSDGEWEEGSNWEALIFLAHHRLANLTVLIDANGLQGFGRTSDVASLEPLAKKFGAFAVDVQEIDGHDLAALATALAVQSALPKIIILRTVKGSGISYMEDCMDWHYLPMSEEQYRQAVSEVGPI
jgi:transketolase